jgi:hypothetical protein
MADEVSVVNVASTAITDPEASAESNGALIQDLFQSDNAKVNVALDALDPNGSKDNKKRESIVTVGGCLAVVQVVRSVSKRRLRRFQRVIESLSWTNSTNCKLLTSHSVSLPTWRMITMKAESESAGLVVPKQLSRSCRPFQSAMTCSGLLVVPYATWQITVLARRKHWKEQAE